MVFNLKKNHVGLYLNSRNSPVHLATDIYHNDPKFLCWQTMSKKADQDHTEQSDQDLKCLPGHLHLLNTLLYGKSMFCKV